MKVGFTGTRNGMTLAQRDAFRSAFCELRPHVTHFHHGACRGADSEAAWWVGCLQPRPHVVAHPGKSAKGGENEWLDELTMKDADEVQTVKTHFARNRDIVDAADILFACPPCKPLPTSGGTLYTVEYARKIGKPIIIAYPDGTIERKPGLGARAG